MKLIQQLMGTTYSCTSTDSGKQVVLELSEKGDAHGLVRPGRWGSMNDPTLEPHCPVYSCVFIDVGSLRHNAAFDHSLQTMQVFGAERPYDKLKYKCTRR